MRSDATLKNSIWGIIQQVLVCILSMFSRRVMLDTIGVQGVGLNAFLTSVISMLSLAELGMGTAIVYHMYAPLAKGDTVRITQLLRFYRLVYRAIAGVITLLGLLILPFIDRLVSDTTYSRGYICLIFLLFLMNTSASYLFTYKRSLISADQKQYIITVFDLIYKTAVIAFGIVILLLTHELAYYLLMLTAFTVFENVLISKKADSLYPYIKENHGSLAKHEMLDIAKNVRHIFIGKVSGVITNSTDSILINMFAGTIQNGLFSNYDIIIGTLSQTINQFSTAMRGSIGNLIAVEAHEHVEKVLNRLLFIMFFIGSFCAVCLTGLIDPFITLAFGDGLLLGRLTVYICIANLYMVAADVPVWNVVAAAGLFKQDKYISVAGSAANLVISFILGKSMGMAGIILGTVATRLIQFILKVMLFYGKFLKRNPAKLFLKNIIYAAVTIGECAAANHITSAICINNPYASFVAAAFACVLISPAVTVILFFKTDEFKYTFGMVKDLILKNFKS